MSRASRWRSALAVATTFVIVSLGYEIRLQKLAGSGSWPIWALWLVSLILAKTGTDLFWRAAVRWQRFRRFILGHTWIEGYWFLETLEYDNPKKEIYQRGILQYSYALPDLALQVYACNLILADNEESETNPICMTVDEKCHVVNYFRRNAYNVQALGVAAGIFNHDNKGPTEQYSGSIIYFEEGKARRQHGYKISDRRATNLSNRLGSNWKQQVLRDPALLDEFLGRESSNKSTAAGQD